MAGFSRQVTEADVFNITTEEKLITLAPSLLFSTALIHTVEASHLISLTLVDIGDNITFDCNASEKDLKFVNWYKQSLGYMVEIVGSVILGQPTISEKFKGSHFAITIKGSRYDLTIFNISKEDEATYLCHIGTTYSQKFISGTFLAVNGKMMFSQNVDSLVITLGGLLACCVIVIVLLIFYIKLKRNCGQTKGEFHLFITESLLY
uniref:Ig-like domain-containing protein n=1 Tax=Poecilia mexicana TaxID=48701 RepID=A0A3B3YUN8_9TELE